MPVSLIFEKADGTVIKGLQDCTTPSASTKEMVDTDLNHGVISPGNFSLPQAVAVKTFSWNNNGDPTYAITNAAIYIDSYYTSDPTYTAESGKTFCGGAGTAVFGDYTDAGGSHTAASDLSNILDWGDNGTGVQVSLDRGRTYTSFATGVGDSVSNALTLSATSMDIGAVDGQLEPGDRAVVYIRIGVPSTFTDPNNAGVLLFNIGLTYSYTE